MFSLDRYSLARFSLGSDETTISVEVTFYDEIKSVAGVAVPVDSTAFFNDVIRGSLRGAIAMKSWFSSSAELAASCKMNANINLDFMLFSSMSTIVTGSQNGKITAAMEAAILKYVYGSKTILSAASFADNLLNKLYCVKDLRRSFFSGAALSALMSAMSQATETVRIQIVIPPGSEIRIDSETYRMLLDGQNVLYAQSGDWITLSRELLYIDVESATGGDLQGSVIYTERYL